MKRKIMTIDEIRAESVYYQLTKDNSAGVCALVEVENMGFCKDGKTRWYHFTNEDNEPCVYYKH